MNIDDRVRWWCFILKFCSLLGRCRYLNGWRASCWTCASEFWWKDFSYKQISIIITFISNRQRAVEVLLLQIPGVGLRCHFAGDPTWSMTVDLDGCGDKRNWVILLSGNKQKIYMKLYACHKTMKKHWKHWIYGNMLVYNSSVGQEVNL